MSFELLLEDVGARIFKCGRVYSVVGLGAASIAV